MSDRGDQLLEALLEEIRKTSHASLEASLRGLEVAVKELTSEVHALKDRRRIEEAVSKDRGGTIYERVARLEQWRDRAVWIGVGISIASGGLGAGLGSWLGS